MNEERVATGLGLFSIGLGVAEVVAGRALGRALGMEDQTGLIRAFGLREIAAGVGIFSQPRPTAWLWARVAGDALDLAALGAAFNDDNPKRDNVGIAIGAVAGVTAVDLWCAWRLSRRGYLKTHPHPSKPAFGPGRPAEGVAPR